MIQLPTLGQYAIGNRKFVVDTQESLRDLITCSGPFDILDGIYSLGDKDLDDFLHNLSTQDSQPALAQLMYFQKYLERFLPGISRQVEAIAIENHKRHNEDRSDKGVLPYALARFSEEEQRLITEHLTWIQMTQGCGGECHRKCAVDAVHRVRDRIPVLQQISLLETIAGCNERVNLPEVYFASDPLEITEDPEDFFLVADKYFKLFNKSLKIATSIPPGREELYKEICKNGFPGILLRISITEYNIKRLNHERIVKAHNLEGIPLPPGITRNVPYTMFYDGLVPNGGVNFVTDESRENIGLDLFHVPGRKWDICNMTSLVMTPYGVFNTIAIPRVDERYPQKKIIVSLNHVSDKPFEIQPGESIDPYLTDCVVRYSQSGESPNRSFYLSNLTQNARVLIDGNGKVLSCHTDISDYGYARPRLF